MKALIVSAGIAGALTSSAAPADEFLAMPGLWKITYGIRGSDADPRAPKVAWHCIDEEANPWKSFAQLEDLPGMSCSRTSLERTSTSLKWRSECHGPGLDNSTAAIETSGAIVFDSPQHYTGWVKFGGTLMGYPLQSAATVEGARLAACTNPSD